MDVSVVNSVTAVDGKEGENVKTMEVLEAKQVYILMSKDHRISRNRRAEWFFSRFDCLVSLLKDAELNSVVSLLEVTRASLSLSHF